MVFVQMTLGLHQGVASGVCMPWEIGTYSF